jgi:hypothetical protein
MDNIPLEDWSGARATKEVGKETINAINKLNKSTTRLNWIMICLTLILVLLTYALVRLTIVLIQR